MIFADPAWIELKGYDKASKIAQKAYLENLTLKEATVKLNILIEKEFNKLVAPP